METTLVAPVHLDLLLLDTEQSVVKPLGAFKDLPFPTSTGDMNSETANISEEIIAQPFQDRSFVLKPGAHLHWALPQALNRSLGGRFVEKSDFLKAFANGSGLWDELISAGWLAPIGTTRASVLGQPVAGLSAAYQPSAPAVAHYLAAPRENDLATVPNRWLVTRSGDDAAAFQQWVVESDYLYPVGEGAAAGAVDIPFPATDPSGGGRPFRYLGRKLPGSQWTEDGSAARLRPFTSAGYGTPSFAAFYPNCHSVFGFYDSAPANQPIAGLRYEVVGWYASAEDDFLAIYLADWKNRYRAANPGLEPSVEEVYAALLEDLSWTVPEGQRAKVPTRCLVYADLKVVSNSIPSTTVANASSVKVSIGNTGTEALSASLAKSIDPTRKGILEDQLEAVQFASILESRRLDVGAEFKEARHDRGFRGIEGGRLWTLVPQSKADERADATTAPPPQLTVDPEIGRLLSSANLLQSQYERHQRAIAHLRHVTFADWYKYMICAYPPEDTRDSYPDIDEVKFFIEKEDIAELNERIAATGRVALTWDGQTLTGASSGDSAPDSAGARLATALSALATAVSAHNTKAAASNDSSDVELALLETSAPRFWQPTEPVALLVGDQVEPAPRYDPERESACGLIELDSFLARDGAGAESLRALIAAAIAKGDWTFAAQQWSKQHWHPFLLEWEVELFPLKQSSNLEVDSNNYAASFLSDNYTLQANQCSLSIKPGGGETVKGANLYLGQSILSPQSGRAMQGSLNSFLRRNCVDEYNANAAAGQAIDNALETQPTPLLTRDEWTRLQAWYETAYLKSSSDDEKAQDGIYTALRAYGLLFDLKCQSQALSGFNDALLMHKQTFQLLVADPLGFPEYKRFTEETVRAAIGDQTLIAPEPQNDFNPIRSGALRIGAMRLVDSFGVPSANLDIAETQTTEQLTNPLSLYPVFMAPRFSQPARLNLRFLSASSSAQEMNAHPATSPICGWVLPNLLDNSLMVYDADGLALGSIYSLAAWNSEYARWDAAPGGTGLTDPKTIENEHLRRMVERIRRLGATFVAEFLSAIESALDNIDPENYAQHEGLALLIGRPVALTRATISAETLGPYAIHHGWESLRWDMQRKHRETNQLGGVNFPVRLGEHGQLNDGLVGYWIENSAQDMDVFFAPQDDLPSSDHIRSSAEPEMSIPMSFESEPVTVSMLIDPRGSIHATTGILPTKSIALPPDQFATALRKIAVTFLSAPIVSPGDPLALPLPAEPGYQWSWVERREDAWSETAAADIAPVNTQATFATGQRLREGWMKLAPSEEPPANGV